MRMLDLCKEAQSCDIAEVYNMAKESEVSDSLLGWLRTQLRSGGVIKDRNNDKIIREIHT